MTGFFCNSKGPGPAPKIVRKTNYCVLFQTSVFSYEEQPISVKSCIVDIAHSYTKRKNVFRLKTYNGSEYLLQADDQMDMLVWIRHISANNNPDLDVSQPCTT
ncbi:hypothetical protein DPMN_018471 [Dreissena polymorpha]|uniref:PH domain-containing protein n=1 Tax=Dreissena polymorpha TaxID=45954 RepID=A0A9D4S8B8_DREPO|nr:hypothetical protein DPMN_018471 [Dreissena polymorpha]